MLCAVLRANPPLEIIDDFICRIWKSYSIDKITLVKRGLLLVRFQDLADKQAVVQKGIYFFDRRSFIVKPWNPEMSLNTVSISSLLLWVKLPNLDIKYWAIESLGHTQDECKKKVTPKQVWRRKHIQPEQDTTQAHQLEVIKVIDNDGFTSVQAKSAAKIPSLQVNHFPVGSNVNSFQDLIR
ncbi:hypothetical protein Cgig2_017254 [Carnegiea gigantea]|uniref:DUF4283 domain-containing protein n=1 Tax=Carnegiea gigantea TaxID=171969 RepID=A0A9Q1GWT3_9CARY|nr:hypothetical protein Cgig2_017254 [Carnegiea gigantea]